MIDVPDAVVATSAAIYQGRSLPAVEIPEAMSPPSLAAIRAAALGLTWSRAALANCGSYTYADGGVPDLLAEGIRSVVDRLAGRPLAIAGARWYRLARGDYSLHLDDAVLLRAHPDVAVEAIVDVSATATGEAEVVFTHRGQSFFVPRQAPGVLAVIARGPTVLRYDRYLTHRVGSAVVDRLRLLLR